MGGGQKCKDQEEIIYTIYTTDMEQRIEDSILQAIKKDDIKEFHALTENFRCETFRLGRFPILSLLYLYKSRKILSEYEERLLQITSFDVLREPIEISGKFAAKAGKCLRLYINNEVVSPLEMLLILDKTKRLKQVFPLTKPTAAIRGRLKSIYYIRYSLTVKFEGNDIVIDKRPLNYREKRKITTACLSIALTVVLIIGVLCVILPINGEISWYWQIDFNSSNEYVLKNDVVIPENFSVRAVNCKIGGGGKKLILRKGVSLGELNGKLSDLTIESAGDPIFTTVSLTSVIENVSVNVNADVTETEAMAFVAMTNYGTIENVTVNVSGSISVIASPTENDDEQSKELAFGGLVQKNDCTIDAVMQTVYVGLIRNCTVNYEQFTLVGETAANASFGGVVGINEGYVQNCTVTGEIIADTFDISGVCSANNRLLSGNVNKANLFQTSSDTLWNPIVSGIVLTNTYAVENCENQGTISSASTCPASDEEDNKTPTASASGIAYDHCGSIVGCKNVGTVSVDTDCVALVGGIVSVAYSNSSYGVINKCVNDGAISANGNGTAYIGGICAQSSSWISYCISSGEIVSQMQTVYAGGIVGFNNLIVSTMITGNFVFPGMVEYCISESTINVSISGSSPVAVGGIVGFVREGLFNDGDYFGGNVTNSYFIGKFVKEVSYCGGIVGACGANIYENNSNGSDNSDNYHFAGNYYSNNSMSSTAFGATVSSDGSFAAATEDKGATAATVENIRNLADYKSILKELGL